MQSIWGRSCLALTSLLPCLPMDILVISVIVAELSRLITGSRIDKVVEEADGSFHFTLRGKGTNYRLLVCANPPHPRILLTNSSPVPIEKPSTFHQFLKSRLTGGRITRVAREGLDRIVRISVETGGPFEAKLIDLIIELPGKSANIIALDADGVILACRRTIPLTESGRGILPGLRYTPAAAPTGVPLDRLTEPISIERIAGLSPLLRKELTTRSGSKDETMAAIKDFLAVLEGRECKPVIYPAEGGNKAVLSAIALLQFDDRHHLSFDSMNEAADSFYQTQTTSATPLETLRSGLRQKMSKQREKVRRTEAVVRRELSAWEGSSLDLVKGQTILTWQGRIPKGVETVDLPGPDGDNISIALDPALSFPANAERYFKRYKKAKRGMETCAERLDKLSQDTEYLELMLAAIDTADTSSDLRRIEEELQTEGYMKKPAATSQSRKKEPAFQPRKEQIEGWEVWVGRSAGDNDELLRHASPDDLWFHAHGVPGSHVIIRNPNRSEIPQEVIHRAARFAARHSKARNEGKVEVIYCLRKFVRKPPGARPGLVTVSPFDSITVTAPF
ncbi:MAG: NFACT family protein [Nitrospirota bacterium]|nr:NFACT family protein [Nitrospirota bacterium]